MPEIPPILYVEDEENDVLLVRMAFDRSGIENRLDVATDGQEAIDYLRSSLQGADGQTRLPRLILLDLNLPKMNGFEVLRLVRQELRLTDLPVVIFSSSEQPPDRSRGKDLGADEYFVKPGSLPEIVEIARVMKERWL
jgi:CheY-like chemotaxis protein